LLDTYTSTSLTTKGKYAQNLKSDFGGCETRVFFSSTFAKEMMTICDFGMVFFFFSLF